jgi:predicted Zn-dependent protease
VRGRLVLCLVAVCVVASTAAIAWLWPPASNGRLIPPATTATIELPTEPESIDVDQLRDEAARGADELVHLYPRSAAAQRTAATLYQFLNQYDLATRHWEECLAIDAKSVEARVSLAKVHLLVGRDTQARDVLMAALASSTATPTVYAQLAEALTRLGELDEAERMAVEGTRRFPDKVELWIAAAQVQFQRSRFAEAKTSVDAGLALEPKSSQALFLAANVYARLGKEAEADEYRRQRERLKTASARDRQPFEEEYNQSLRRVVAALFGAMALEYQAHGESTRAEHWCRRAIALEPQSLDPYRLLVSVYRAGDQLANALLAQRRLMDLEPANVINRVNFASLAVALGRLDEGEEALDKAARMAPQNGLVRRMLAAVYIQRQELDKARAAAEQAVEVEPSPDSYRLLAEDCRRQGDLPAAEAAARAAEKRGASDEP